MPYELKKVSARKYKVVNTETGVEHAHATSKTKGEAQIRLLNMLHHQQGGGFFQDLGKSIKNVANKAVQGVADLGNKALNLGNKVINPSSAYPPELQKLKDDIGNELITEIEVRRTPVPQVISSLMNIVSLGSFKKKLSRTSYDDLFHLFIVVKTDKNHSFLLEKNARIHATRNVPNLPNTTTMKVSNIPADLTVASLIDNTEKQMGDRFLPYNPVSNNCQDFITAVLQANKLATPELTTFVKQNTDSLFKSDPTLAKISKSLTDLGASADVLMSGGKISKKKTNNSHFISSVNIHMNTFTEHRLPQSEKQVRSHLGIPIHLNIHAGEMSGGAINWGDLGKSIARSLNIPTDEAGAKNLAKKVVSQAGSAVGQTILGGIGSTIGGPALGIPAAMLGSVVGSKAADKANEQIGNGMRGRGRPRKMAMDGSGFLDKFLDKPFTARQAIQLAKNVPGLAKEAAADIRGAGLASDAMNLAMYGVAGKKIPKQRGITSGVVPMSGMGLASDAMDLAMYGVAGKKIPKQRGITSGVVSMPMSGMGTGKGSDAMKAKMAALRARKGNK